MASYLIKREDTNKKIKDKTKIGISYEFKPRLSNNELEIEKVTIYNKEIINKIISKKIEKNYKRLAAIVYDIKNDCNDDSTSDTIIALDEISKFKNIIMYKYHKLIEKELEKEYLKKLILLEKELEKKIVLDNYFLEEMNINKGKGR